MNSTFEILKNRLYSAFRWEPIRSLLLSIATITLVISIFDFEPDLEIWFYEVMRNFVIAGLIAFVDHTLLRLSGINLHNMTYRSFLAVTFLLICGGLIGGFLGLVINDWLFGFYVTSTLYYAIIVSILSLIFGFIVFIIASLRERLQKMVHKLAEKEINEQRLLQLKTRAELEALRAKINPHFLFNTMNSISGLMHEDPDKADEILQKLANLFRYTLDSSHQEFTKLQDEIEVIEEYLAIEKIRLQGRLTYHIELDDGLRKTLIPTMLLQPLVENSIKHGIAPQKTGGYVKIKCQSINGKCQIEISDSGQGFDETASTKGFGLRSVKERLALYYGQQHDLQIDQEKGTLIRIILPAESLKTEYINLKMDNQ